MGDLWEKMFFENKNMQRILISALAEAKRPIILIGEGVRTSNTIQEVKTFSQHCCIPILSSRCSEDIVSGFKYYYGYIEVMAYDMQILYFQNRI